MPEEGIIPSNFDENDWIDAAASNVACLPWPSVSDPPNGEDGKLRVNCFHSHIEYSDPILFFGRPGAAHLHMFFGNTLANHSSTYNSLRTTGSGTCSGGPINRTGYWHPAMISPAMNKVVIPTSYTIYYTVATSRHDKVTAFISSPGELATTDFPRGFAFIAGWPDASHWIGSAISGTQTVNLQDESTPSGVWFFDDDETANQFDPDNHGEHWADIDAAIAGAQASAGGGAVAGTKLHARLTFPECWDGVNLTSANGRTHVAYRRQDGGGNNACPSTHNFTLPQILVMINYDHEGPADCGQWYISSDHGHGPPTGDFNGGHTMHMDWFGGWSQAVTDVWALLVNGIGGASSFATSCNNGNLGNDTALIESHFPAYTTANFLAEANRYMDIPSPPTNQVLMGQACM